MRKKIIAILIIIGTVFSTVSLNAFKVEGAENQNPPANITKLKIEEIKGGIGIKVVLKNVGNVDILNVNLICDDPGDHIEIFPQKQFNIPLIKKGETSVVFIGIFDIGLEILSPIEITMVVSAPNINALHRMIYADVIGPFVNIVGIFFNDGGTFDGYTLYTPFHGVKTYLINDYGDIVHTWNSFPHTSGTGVYLLENGNLLRAESDHIYDFLFWRGGGGTGRIDMYDWDGNLIWWYLYISSNYCLHNDIKPLPNGNILMISWERISDAVADHLGRNPNVDDGDMLIDYIIEVEPTTPGAGNIVWEWHAQDHLIQQYNPQLPNYSCIADHPELIDINIPRYRNAEKEPTDFLHMNSLDYNEQFDQILISLRNINETMIIDHSTTTAQAASHQGGNSGKGGDILYRWGNPRNYKAPDKQQLFGQHDARWIKSGCPGAGHITIFNNGIGLGFSSAIEIVPPVDANGNYYLVPHYAYEPTASIWEWVNEEKYDFYSEMGGGAQRLPNGNTVICDGWGKGQIIEVTPQNEIISCYTNLFPFPLLQQIFKSQHYPIDYPGIGEIQNEPIELMTEIDMCKTEGAAPWLWCSKITLQDDTNHMCVFVSVIGGNLFVFNSTTTPEYFFSFLTHKAWNSGTNTLVYQALQQYENECWNGQTITVPEIFNGQTYNTFNNKMAKSDV